MIQRSSNRLWPPLVIIAWFLFTLGVSLPTILYSANAAEFSIVLRDFLLVSLTTLFVSLALCAAALRGLAFLRTTRAVALFFALALLVWLQSNLLAWDYGPLDGRVIDWNAFTYYGYIDGLVWLAIIALALLKPAAFYRAGIVIAPTILALQVGLLVFSSKTELLEDAPGTLRGHVLDQQSKFALSRDRNVLLIILDETQSDVVGDILEREEAYRTIFDGFTYFPDSVAASNYTEVAIPALLTASLYDNSRPKVDYMQEAFLHHSVFAAFKKHGFQVEVYPWLGWGNESIFFDPRIADNISLRRDAPSSDGVFLSEMKVKEIVHLLDLSIFRSVPHFLKRCVHNDQQWFINRLVTNLVPRNVKQIVSTDNEFEANVFADQAMRNLRIDRTGDVFKYYHLKGAHSPLMVEEDLTLADTPLENTRANYVLQVKASLKSLEKLFSLMKAKGVYDRSLIMVTADHGSGATKDLYVESAADARPSLASASIQYSRDFGRDKARGIPLVMVKRFAARGPVTRSDRPVSLLDLPVTLASEAGVPYEHAGVSVFDSNRAPTDDRPYAAFDFTQNKLSYVGEMTLYNVRGHSWRDDSWHVIRLLHPPPAERSESR